MLSSPSCSVTGYYPSVGATNWAGSSRQHPPPVRRWHGGDLSIPMWESGRGEASPPDKLGFFRRRAGPSRACSSRGYTSTLGR